MKKRHPQQAIVVGAGMAGLCCARELQRAGFGVVVLEKSADIGGRIATRRRSQGIWNHGAPSVRAESEAFVAMLAELVAAGSAVADPHLCFRGLPDMRELLRPLAIGSDIRFAAELAFVERQHDGWRLGLEDGSELRCDVLLFATPAPQAGRLLAAPQDPRLTAALEALETVEMEPRWTLLVRYADEVDLSAVVADPVIAAVRPGCAGSSAATDTWVVEGSVPWSRDVLERESTDIAAMLVAAVGRQLGEHGVVPPQLLSARAHRWRFAETSRPLGRGCWWDAELRLGMSGDWCLGPRAEDAFTSGLALAGAVLDGRDYSREGSMRNQP